MHFHYVLSLGAVFGIFVATYLWLPKITGRPICEFTGRLHFILMFLGANLIFLPQHFLGLSGIKKNWFSIFYYFIYVMKVLELNYLDLYSYFNYSQILFSSNIPKILRKVIGPHIKPEFLKYPIRVYYPNLDRNIIGIENRNRAVIYQWINLITGDTYVGSASKGTIRLLNYFYSSYLSRNLLICNSLRYYGHNNFCLGILEDLGHFSNVSKEDILKREQYYLNILFNKFASRKLNLLQKLVYVYESDTLNLIGIYPTKNCSKLFNMSKDTLSKYLKNGKSFKGKFFSRSKLV